MSDDPTAAFADLVARHRQDLPLDEAAILVAAHALDDVDVSSEQARLDRLAEGLSVATLAGLRDHLVGLGFAGDPDTYHDPRNSLLPEVLDRRRGIPLTLAVVALEVGRRRDVPLVGIGMPGHFLVRSADDHDRFLDLFAGGRLLDRDGCRSIFEHLHPGARWEDRFLDPVDAAEIVRRMLANLASAYRRSGSRDELTWTMGLRLHLPGVTEHERRELAVLLGAAGRYDDAADLLEATGQQRDRQAAARYRARLN